MHRLLGFHFSFFFNDTATTEIYTLSLHDALPISFRKALQLSPEFVGARLNLALLLTHLRRFQLALEAYRQVLAEQPSSAPASDGVRLVLGELKRFPDSRKAFVRAVEADPQNARAHS